MPVGDFKTRLNLRRIKFDLDQTNRIEKEASLSLIHACGERVSKRVVSVCRQINTFDTIQCYLKFHLITDEWMFIKWQRKHTWYLF